MEVTGATHQVIHRDCKSEPVARAIPDTAASLSSHPGVKTCIICLESAGMPAQTLTVRCRHVSRVCASCVQGHVHREIVINKKTSVSCVEKGGGCSEKLLYGELRKITDPETFAVYDELLAMECIREEGDFLYCSRPGCTSGQMTIGDIMKCQTCNWLTCVHHRTTMHEGYTCAQYDLMVQPLVFDEKTKPCPVCKIPIENIGGCDRFTCRRTNGGCGAIFCWVCAAPYRGKHGIRTVGNSAHNIQCKHYRDA